MFVLQSIVVGNIDQSIEFFAAKNMQIPESLPLFLAPLISILKNIYDAVNTLGLKNNQKYDNLAEILNKSDSFDPLLFRKL